MKIDFKSPTSWVDLNDRLSEELGLSESNFEVRSYLGTHHAVTETITGLAKLYPLKKKIVFLKNFDPCYAEGLTALAKEGYQLNGIESDHFFNFDELKTKIEKDTLCVLYSVDDPLFGLKNSIETFKNQLKEETVQQIFVSHADHFITGIDKTPGKNSTYIYGINKRQAVSIVGERARIGALSTSSLSWPTQWDLTTLIKVATSNKEVIQKFESQEIAGAKPFFPADIERVWDRAVIYWPDMDGYALTHLLIEKMNWPHKPPGENEKLETISLSRWGSGRIFELYKNKYTDAKMWRGTIIVSADIIDEKFQNVLTRAREEILKDQYGN
jgi:hypothetical protein